jgi:methylglutaconyl-CoA hydratase
VQQVVAPDRLEAAVQSALSELLQAGPQAQAEIKSPFAQLQVGPVSEQVHELTAA